MTSSITIFIATALLAFTATAAEPVRLDELSAPGIVQTRTPSNSVALLFKTCVTEVLVNRDSIPATGICASGYVLLTDEDPAGDQYLVTSYTYDNLVLVRPIKTEGELTMLISPWDPTPSQ